MVVGMLVQDFDCIQCCMSTGKANYPSADTHYVPVAPRNPADPCEVNYDAAFPNKQVASTPSVGEGMILRYPLHGPELSLVWEGLHSQGMAHPLQPVYDEYVVFQSSQVLVRYIVRYRLGSSGASPAPPPAVAAGTWTLDQVRMAMWLWGWNGDLPCIIPVRCSSFHVLACFFFLLVQKDAHSFLACALSATH